MKIAFDTNIILDAVLRREEYEYAQELVSAVGAEKIKGIITANSITDIYYIAKKSIGDEKAKKVIADILYIFDVVPVDGRDCAYALTVPMKDYEDAVLAVCAKRENADYIATHDMGFIESQSPVAAKKPRDILGIIGLESFTE